MTLDPWTLDPWTLDLGPSSDGFQIAEGRPGLIRLLHRRVATDLRPGAGVGVGIEGRLAGGKSAYDVMRATFPAGTVSGSPKVRAMQIINELEKSKRCAYSGAVGYFGFDGNHDSCIALRTAVLNGGKAYVQAGAGVVADSDPEYEFNETVNKAMGLVRGIESAA